MNTSNLEIITSGITGYYDSIQPGLIDDYSESDEPVFARLDLGWVIDKAVARSYSWNDLIDGIDTGTISNNSIFSNSLIGSSHSDVIIGNEQNNYLDGGDGADYIDGGKGNDIIFGGLGKDWLIGGKGNDLLNGGAEWGETLDGGEGLDIIDYTGDTLDGKGVYIRLDQNFVTTLEIKDSHSWLDMIDGINNNTLQHDNLISIENAIGSQYSDSINGDDGDNILHGGVGGNDWIGGGRGNDTASYEGNTEDGAGVFVRLNLGWAWSSEDNYNMTWQQIVDGINNNILDHDKLGSIENVIGSIHSDSLGGDNNNNVIDGREGNDYLSGGHGDDVLIGGLGVDHIVAGSGNDMIFADEADSFINGGTGFDIVSFEDVNGDNEVNINLASQNYSGLEAIVIGSDLQQQVHNINVSLDQIASDTEGTYDDMFFAIGIDTLTFSDSVGIASLTQDLDGNYEAELIALLGLDESTQLQSTTYETEGGNFVTVIQDVIIDSDMDIGGIGSQDFMGQESMYIA
ncbi:calcium-binding protein [Pseudoalteromonas sp. FUC4]|uniref:calcium-binding protein n=1 Tax=Pseudoalteromonas sp. FUC4 TaxID=2511201 RepID=UPI0011F21C53|nr:calcium-binding protein [Pseudoalteromonas sp. FUC4]KAA1155045.1 calcium-binding protein [Pseudoalteromonas sp. FUC4]